MTISSSVESKSERLPALACAVRGVAVVALAFAIGGCGVLAAPCRVTSAVFKMVPLVGHAAAIPTDACAAVIDP